MIKKSPSEIAAHIFYTLIVWLYFAHGYLPDTDKLKHDDVIKWTHFLRYWPFVRGITLTPYMVLPLFATRFADYAGGIRVPFI